MALQKYYELLALALRLLLSVFISRGMQNLQSQQQIRAFLNESRLNILGALKRHQGINGEVPPTYRHTLQDVVKSYSGLISIADYLEVSLFTMTLTSGMILTNIV